jgi:hypothetical protein
LVICSDGDRKNEFHMIQTCSFKKLRFRFFLSFFLFFWSQLRWHFGWFSCCDMLTAIVWYRLLVIIARQAAMLDTAVLIRICCSTLFLVYTGEIFTNPNFSVCFIFSSLFLWLFLDLDDDLFLFLELSLEFFPFLWCFERLLLVDLLLW